jgi:hypothetical protein
MIMLSQNGSFTLNILDDHSTGDSKAMIDLPADLVEQPSDLFDKVFAFTFDVLGLKTVELRVRSRHVLHVDSAARTQRQRRA